MWFIKKIKQNYFAYLVSCMTLLFVCASFYRFYIQQNYLVAYEGECDPTTESCYKYCEDNECTEPFFYSVIERNASITYEMCGPDVTTCDKAYNCDNDSTCTIYFCDAEIDGIDACAINPNEL